MFLTAYPGKQQSLTCMGSIEELSVFGCEIHHLLPLGNASYHFDNYPFISILDMRCNSIENVPADSYWGFTKLQALFLTHNKIKTFGNQSFYSIEQFVNMTHLHELRMEKAQLTGSHLYDVVNNQSLFTGLHALKRLRLKDNDLHSLDSRVFYNLSKLYYLDMTNSNIHVLRHGVFHPLSSLADLRLSGNKLAEIAGDTFHGLSYLYFFNLQNNGLRGLEVTTFAQNPKLKILLLSGNQISIIKPGTVLPSNSSLRLDVSRNPFTCTCSLTWFRQWLHSANIDLKNADQTLCSGTSLKEFADKPILSFHPEDHCGVNIILIVVLSFSGVLVGVMALLVYNKRLWLNHKIFLLKLAIVGYTEMEEDFNAGNYRHHLNLMFQETEEEWVNQVMKPALEERLPHLQNIIYGDEDLHLGMYYINALYDAIDNSFKTVLLLSNQSVNDAWTMTKLRMALEHINDTGLDKVILIFVEDIEDENMPYLVRLFLSRNRPYMLWTEDEDGQELFWLFLTGNKLNDIPCETLAVLPRLHTMDLKRNKIRSLNFDGYGFHQRTVSLRL
eukprot:XP_011675978.1 PREDICTED: toll-like receptor 4 [Strongylocentrotus purpuratus]